MAAGTSHTTISIKLNEQGFHDIFNKYYVTLCLFANQYTENQETSADIVQDSFAKLWQIREDFFYLHQVKAFLYTAVFAQALIELEKIGLGLDLTYEIRLSMGCSKFH